MTCERPLDFAARQSAPTLVGSSFLEAHRLPEVWTPRRGLTWFACARQLAAVISGPLALLAFVALTVKSADPAGFIYLCIVWVWAATATTFWGRSWPSYLITDDAGIVVKTSTGSRTFRWCEIRSAKLRRSACHCYLKLIVSSREHFEVDLSGFSRDSQRRLMEVITVCRQVAPLPGGKGSFFQSEMPWSLPAGNLSEAA